MVLEFPVCGLLLLCLRLCGDTECHLKEKPFSLCGVEEGEGPTCHFCSWQKAYRLVTWAQHTMQKAGPWTLSLLNTRDDVIAEAPWEIEPAEQLL